MPLLPWSTFNNALLVETSLETCGKCVVVLLPIAPWAMEVGGCVGSLETIAERGPSLAADCDVAVLNLWLSRRIVSSTYL